MITVIAVLSFVGVLFLTIGSHMACKKKLDDYDGMAGIVSPKENKDNNVIWKL